MVEFTPGPDKCLSWSWYRGMFDFDNLCCAETCSGLPGSYVGLHALLNPCRFDVFNVFLTPLVEF